LFDDTVANNKKAAEAAYVPVILLSFLSIVIVIGKPQQDGCARYTTRIGLRQVDADQFVKSVAINDLFCRLLTFQPKLVPIGYSNYA
jgi:hypothetical protein